MKKFLILLLFLLSFYAYAQKIIYVVHAEAAPGNFKPGTPYYNLKEALRRLGYDARWVKRADVPRNYEYVVFFNVFGWDIEYIKKHPREKLIAFLWEPPTVLPHNYGDVYQKYFSKIVTWNDSLVDNDRFFQFCYPVLGGFPKNPVPFEQKALCVMMNRNKDSSHPFSLYGERRNLINFFEEHHGEDFDLYGYGWEKAGFKNYKGTVGNKHGCLARYKFYFAYENMQHISGYVTEKIFDAFRSGCVPVYWGAENVTDYVPKSCFIDRRDFENDEQLYQFLKNVTEEEYNVYLNNIKYFLESDEALLFSWEHFIHIFLSVIEPGYDKNAILTSRQLSVVERLSSIQKG